MNMALRCKLLRSLTSLRPPNRFLSTSSPTPPASSDKVRAALSHLKFEQDPQRILEICRAAALTPESHLDRLAYSKAIGKLRESNHHDTIRALIHDSMAQLDCKSERVVSHFIILYGRGGLIGDAIKLFDEMPERGVERNVKTLNSLLFACVLGGEYGEMKRVFLEFPKKYGLTPNLDTYNTVLKGFCESGGAGWAHAILAEMERKGVRPNAKTFSTAVAGFYTEEKFEDVGKVTELMKRYGMQLGIGIYNVRIQGLSKLGRVDEAKALFDGVVSRGMKPNCVTYGNLIHGFCRKGKLDVAKGLFEEMVDKGLQPEAGCYFTLVYFLCQGRDFDAALRVCKESISKGWVPNISTMKSLVDGLVSTDKVNEARQIIGQLKEKFSRNGDSWIAIEEALPK